MKGAWWVSWYSPLPNDAFELHSPWWRTGYAERWDNDENDYVDVTIYCAAVRADSEDEAMQVIADAYDSKPHVDDIEWRFVDEVHIEDWNPFNGRFPQAAWMAWDGDRTCNCEQHKA